MKKTVLVLLLALLVAAVTAAPAGAVTPLRPAPTPPDTDSVLILHGAFNVRGYWWDHTDLTVAVQAHPNVDEASLAAVRQAIADWNFALQQEFNGLITLTDVTDQYTAKHKADIVVHYNPTAGGMVFGGMAVCGAFKCPNVIVRSDLPPPVGFTYPPQYLVLRDDARARPRAWPWACPAADRVDGPDGLRLALEQRHRADAVGVRPGGHRGRVRVGARRRRPLFSIAAVGGLLRTSCEGQPSGWPSQPSSGDGSTPARTGPSPWGMSGGHEAGDSKGQQRCPTGSCALAFTSSEGSKQGRSLGHAVYGM